MKNLFNAVLISIPVTITFLVVLHYAPVLIFIGLLVIFLMPFQELL